MNSIPDRAWLEVDVRSASAAMIARLREKPGAEEIEVSFSNRDSVKARVVGEDRSTDLAVLKVDVDARALTPLRLDLTHHDELARMSEALQPT